MNSIEVSWDENAAYANDRGWRISVHDEVYGLLKVLDGRDIVALINEGLRLLELDDAIEVRRV